MRLMVELLQWWWLRASTLSPTNDIYDTRYSQYYAQTYQKARLNSSPRRHDSTTISNGATGPSGGAVRSYQREPRINQVESDVIVCVNAPPGMPWYLFPNDAKTCSPGSHGSAKSTAFIDTRHGAAGAALSFRCAVENRSGCLWRARNPVPRSVVRPCRSRRLERAAGTVDGGRHHSVSSGQRPSYS